MEEADYISETPINPVKKKNKKLKRFLKWSLISILSTIFLLVASAFIIIYFFEDDVKKYAIEQINKEVNTKIEVKDIKLSLFKKFPMASLEFIQVKCIEVTNEPKKENLLEAESVFLEFSVWDIFKGKYKFKKLSVENGKLNLKINNRGQSNFDILKKPKLGTPVKKSEMSFKFNEFILKNVHFIFNDQQSKQLYRAQIKKLNCSGAFTDKQFTLKAKANIFSEIIIINDEEFVSNKNFFLNTTLEVNKSNQLLTIKKANIELENMKIDLNGNVKYDSTAYVDLSFNGENLNIQSFLSLLPSTYKNFEKKYKSHGEFYLKGSIKGSLANTNQTQIIAQFGIKNGKIKFIEEGLEMKNIFFDGNFNTGAKKCPETAEINFKHFEGQLENSTFSGNFHLNNLDKPHLKFQIDADVDLAEVFKFIPVEKIESISGRVKTTLVYEGTLESNSFTLEDYKKSASNGNVLLDKVSLKIKDKPLQLSNCSGEIIFENTIGRIPQLTGQIASTEFNLKGEAINLPEYFYLEGYPLIIKANISCGEIAVEEFLTKDQPTKKQNDLTLNIPENINLELQAKIKELSFKKFSASNIEGLVIIKDRQLFAENLHFESCGGTSNISGSVNTKDPENIVTQAFGSFDKIDISQLFGEFDNFSQKTLEDKHIRGSTNANIAYSASFDSHLKMKMNTLYVNSPLEITNGELINFKPLEGLSKFIHVEELRDIKFSTLTNTITIKDEAVIIPKMSIQSNALNLEIGGIHYFDNRIEYYFNVFLKDLIAAKWKKRKTEDEFGEFIEEEGGARIYLKMVGTMDNNKITIDNKGVKDKLKDDMKKENQDFKQIFYEEFGLFKNDSTVKKSNLVPPKKEKKNKVNQSDDFEFE